MSVCIFIIFGIVLLEAIFLSMSQLLKLRNRYLSWL